MTRIILLAYDGMDAEHKIQTEGIAMLGRQEQDKLKDYQRDMVRQMSLVLTSAAPDLAADHAKLRAATMSVFGMLNWFYMWNSGAGTEEREAYADVVTSLTLKGLNGL